MLAIPIPCRYKPPTLNKSYPPPLTHKKAIELKGGMLPIMTLQLLSADLEQIKKGLDDKIQQAQGFFIGSPVALDFTPLTSVDINVAKVQKIVREAGLVPITSHCNDPQLQEQLIEIGLTSVSKHPHKQIPEPTKESAEKGALTQTHHTPVRSGQQVYAKGGDLVLITQTSAGSEVIADGNIHIYGALRGRALCGASGDTKARIFCQQFEAELVAVAGHYKLLDDVSESLKGAAVQIWLEDETLKIEKLTH